MRFIKKSPIQSIHENKLISSGMYNKFYGRFKTVGNAK